MPSVHVAGSARSGLDTYDTPVTGTILTVPVSQCGVMRRFGALSGRVPRAGSTGRLDLRADRGFWPIASVIPACSKAVRTPRSR